MVGELTVGKLCSRVCVDCAMNPGVILATWIMIHRYVLARLTNVY